MKGIGSNLKNEGKKKGGLKVHVMIDAHFDTPEFVNISESKRHDKAFMQYLTLAPHSMIVFDKAYNHYLQFAQWPERQINFVCRLKKNVVYQVVEVLFDRDLTPGPAVLKQEYIMLKYKQNKVEKTFCRGR